MPGKPEKEKIKAEKAAVWKRFKPGDVDPDTGKKLTKTTAEKKNKQNRTERIRKVVQNYQEGA